MKVKEKQYNVASSISRVERSEKYLFPIGSGKRGRLVTSCERAFEGIGFLLSALGSQISRDLIITRNYCSGARVIVSVVCLLFC